MGPRHSFIFGANLWIREVTSLAVVWRSVVLHCVKRWDRGWEASESGEESKVQLNKVQDPGGQAWEWSQTECRGASGKKRGILRQPNNIFGHLVTWAKSKPALNITTGVKNFSMWTSAFLWFIVKCWSWAPLYSTTALSPCLLISLFLLLPSHFFSVLSLMIFVLLFDKYLWR